MSSLILGCSVTAITWMSLPDLSLLPEMVKKSYGHLRQCALDVESRKLLRYNGCAKSYCVGSCLHCKNTWMHHFWVSSSFHWICTPFYLILSSPSSSLSISFGYPSLGIHLSPHCLLDSLHCVATLLTENYKLSCFDSKRPCIPCSTLLSLWYLTYVSHYVTCWTE